LAQKAGEIWKEHGALEYRESVGDDLEIEDMVLSNLRQMRHRKKQ
jgi:uncharacterized protein YbaA (DUF1428 family)